jgi:hypothetical protein
MRECRCLNCVDCTITCAELSSFVCGAWESYRFWGMGRREVQAVGCCGPATLNTSKCKNIA